MKNSIKYSFFVSVPIFILSIGSSYFAYLLYEITSANISFISEEIKILITASIVSMLLAYVATIFAKRIYNIQNSLVKTSIIWFHVIFAIEVAYYAIFSDIVQWLLPNDIPTMLLPFSIIMCTAWGYGLMTKIWELRGHKRSS